MYHCSDGVGMVRVCMRKKVVELKKLYIETISPFLQLRFKNPVRQTANGKALSKGKCPLTIWQDPEERLKNYDWGFAKVWFSHIALLNPHWQNYTTLSDMTFNFNLPLLNIISHLRVKTAEENHFTWKMENKIKEQFEEKNYAGKIKLNKSMINNERWKDIKMQQE